MIERARAITLDKDAHHDEPRIGAAGDLLH
jgi:hypothetical protein